MGMFAAEVQDRGAAIEIDCPRYALEPGHAGLCVDSCLLDNRNSFVIRKAAQRLSLEMVIPMVWAQVTAVQNPPKGFKPGFKPCGNLTNLATCESLLGK